MKSLFSSPKILPLIFLILLPILFMTSHYILISIAKYDRDITKLLAQSNPDKADEIVDNFKFRANFVSSTFKYFQFGLLVFITIVYPIYPYFYSTDNYFKKKKYVNVVVENQFIKRLFEFSLIPFIGSSFLFFVIFIADQIHSENGIISLISNKHVVNILIVFIIIGSATILKMLCLFLRTDFRYYFAIGCLKILNDMKDETKRIKYLDMTLDSYNKYLIRTTKIEIKDIDKIYARIIYTYASNKDESILLILSKSFENSSLDFFRYLSTTFLKDQDPNNFLIKESYYKSLFWGIKKIGTFLAAAIPLLLSIIEVYIKV